MRNTTIGADYVVVMSTLVCKCDMDIRTGYPRIITGTGLLDMNIVIWYLYVKFTVQFKFRTYMFCM